MTDQTAVLVVEDEALILLDIVFHLEIEGFKVYEAANADAAIKLLDQHAEIRVIFTDIDMPGSMDGLKLAAAVRDRWPPVQIIVTSGRALGAQEQIPTGGIFFPKPYVHDTITHSIREMLIA